MLDVSQFDCSVYNVSQVMICIHMHTHHLLRGWLPYKNHAECVYRLYETHSDQKAAAKQAGYDVGFLVMDTNIPSLLVRNRAVQRRAGQFPMFEQSQ